MIKDLLNKIEYNELTALIGSDRLSQIKKIVEQNSHTTEIDNKDILIQIVQAIYGFDLFYEKRARQLIYFTINHNELIYLSKKYCKSSFPKAYDNALALSILPWKYGSEFVAEIANILALPTVYLPNELEDTPNSIELTPYPKYFDLHNYQEELKGKIISELLLGTDRFLVQMPTGSGKTRTVQQSIIEYLHISKLVEKRSIILWLAHTEELCEQAIETFSNLWPNLSNYSMLLQRAYGSYSISPNDEQCILIVSTLQKFASLLEMDSYFLIQIKKYLSVILVDEAHKAIAKTYSKSLNYLLKDTNASLIGLTATPGRNTSNIDDNNELANFFNRKLLVPNFSENPITELRNAGILSFLKRKVIKSNLDIFINEKENNNITLYGDFSQILLKKLANDLNRNKLIIKTIEEEIKKQNPCLVFACSVEHSHILNAALNFKNHSALTLDSKTPKNRRKKIIDSFKKGECQVLLNFGILSTGFDSPNIRTIIICRPTSSIVLYSQMLGRGLRGPKMGGAKECNLIDIKDNFENFGNIENVYNYFDGYWGY